MPWRVKCNKQTQKYAPTPCGDPCGGDPRVEAGTGVTQTQSRQIGGKGPGQGRETLQRAGSVGWDSRPRGAYLLTTFYTTHTPPAL